MSTQQVPLTYEGILEMFRETDRKFQETDRKFQETDRKFQETDRKFQETDWKFQETDRKFQETDRKFQETERILAESARQIKINQQEIGGLGSSIGRLVENMVKGKIIKKFQTLGYDVTGCSPNKEYVIAELGIDGEVDLLLDDGPVGILIEVKTTLEPKDVLRHIDRLEEYRRYADAKGFGDKQRFIGAVAGASIRKDAVALAQENGMYVIVQSGDAVEIKTPPEGFKAKEW
jgi:hypothetical protein